MKSKILKFLTLAAALCGATAWGTTVAKVGETEYTDLAEAIMAALAANDNVPVELLSNIDLTGKTWTSVVYSGGKLAIDGQGFMVKGLSAPLLNKQGSGGHELTMSNVTFKDATVSSTDDYAAVIVPYADSMNKLSFTNVTIDQAQVTSSKYAGAFVGYAAGYNVQNDGPVFQQVTFDNCTVKNSKITGAGSTGALMGHAAGNPNAKIIVRNGTTVQNNVITCSDTSSTDKAGSLFGTVGDCGKGYPEGGIEVAATVSGNTVTSGSTTITTIYGRRGSEGLLKLLPGGSYDAAPINASDTWATVADGYAVAKGPDNLWGVVEAAAPAVDFAAFVKALTDANYTFDGSTHALAQNGKLTVKWSPVSGCYDTREGHECTVGNVAATANTPKRVNSGLTQFQLFEGASHAVSVKNVAFVYEPAAFTVCENSGWKGSFTAEQAPGGQIFLMNTGDVTFEDCSFDKVVLTSFNCTGTSTVKDCSFKNVYNSYAVKDIRGANVAVTGCTFENCGAAVMVSSTVKVDAVTISDNTFKNVDVAGTAPNDKVGTRGLVQIASLGDYADTAFDFSGNTATACGPVLRQLNETVSFDADDKTDLGNLVSAGGSLYTGDSVPAAKIGETKYDSLEAALADVAEGAPLTWVAEGAWPVKTPVYYNGTFYETGTGSAAKGALERAIDAANAANAAAVAKIYVRPGFEADELVLQAHQQLKTGLAIYGNDAKLARNWEPCVEYPGTSGDSGAHQLTKDVSLAIYNLHNGAGFWGRRTTAYTVDLKLSGCRNAYQVMFYGNADTGVKGKTNISVTNCTFDATTKADHNVLVTIGAGTVDVSDTTFTAANINVKNVDGGDNVITVKDCTFKDTVAGNQNIRVRSYVEGTHADLTIENVTFTGDSTQNVEIGDSKAECKGVVSYTITQTSGTLNVYKQGVTTAEATTLDAAVAYSGDNVGTIADEKALRRAFCAAPTDGTVVMVKLGADITLETLYAAENFGTEKLDDNAAGDTFNRYKVGVHPTAENPNQWNPLVTEQTQEQRLVYGAYYHMAAKDERIARLVVKSGQRIVLDLNGHTIQKAARANHGDWSNVCTDIIGNYGTLEIVDSSTGTKGTIKGIGYFSCGGAVLHNYAGATMTVTGVNVDGNAAGMSAGTGQYVVSNEGGTLTIDGANVFDTATSASLIMSNGGTVTIKNATLNHPEAKVINAKGGVINIESASVTSDKYAVFATGDARVNVNGSLTIEGTGTLCVEGDAATVTKKPGIELSAPAGFTWVENDGVEVLRSFVAKVGETTYTTLADAFAAATAGQTVTLLADVDMTGTEWTPIDNFTGTFDGAGHTIKNLVVANDENYTGFFNVLKGTVKDVTFENCKVTGQRCGILAGAADTFTAQNVVVKNCEIVGSQKCGGLVGYVRNNNPATVTGCQVNGLQIKGADADGVWQAGGLLGFVQTVKGTVSGNTVSGISIEDAYKKYLAGGAATTRQYASHAFIAVIVNTSNGRTYPSDADHTLTISGNSVEQCAETMVYRDEHWTSFCGDYADWEGALSSSNPYPTKLIIDGVEVTAPVAKIGTNFYGSLEDAVAAVQDGETITVLNYDEANMTAPDGWKFVTKEGVTTLELDVITISTVEELVAFSAAVNGGERYANKIVRLTQDLDMTGIDFVPIGNVSDYPGKSFYGVFDGQNHTIRNLTVSDTTEDYASAALFGSLCGTVQNVKLENVNITSSHYAAALVGYSSDGNTTAVIKNCHVDGGTVTSTPEEVSAGTYDNGDKVGGLAGYLAQGVALEGCTVKNLTVTAYRDVAGLVGYANTGVTVKNSSVTDTTVVSDHRYNYKNYASDELYDANEIIGEASSSAVLTDNTFSNVDFAILENVAQIGETRYYSLQDAMNAAFAAGPSAVEVEILSDITLTDWTPVNFDSYPANMPNSVTIKGNNHVIKGLTKPLVEKTWTGTALEFDDLTISDANIDVADTESNGVGAFIGYVDSTESITLKNCSVKNSTIKGGHWCGGLIGYCCGYSNTNDGAVFTTVTLENCKVDNTTVMTTTGSAGALIGHATGSAWTKIVVTGDHTTVTDNTIVGENAEKTGVLFGTVGAGQTDATNNKNGGIEIAYATVSGNVTKYGDSATPTDARVFGRIGTEGGTIAIKGGSFEDMVFPEALDTTGVYAISGGTFSSKVPEQYCAAGFIPTAVDENGAYTVKAGAYVAKITVGEVTTKYETLAEAVAAATAGQTITLISDVADAGNVSLKAGVTLDGDGHKVTGNSAVWINKAGGTVQNVVFEDIHKADSKLSAVYASGLEGTATITGCTFDNCDWDAIQATPVAGAELTITGNVFDTDNTDGVQQQRYVHIESAVNVDFTATVTGNVMKGDTKQGALEAYYFADEEKIDVSHNYIEDMADVCILDGTGALRNDMVFPAYKDAEKTELYQPVAMIATSAYSANYYPTVAAALIGAKSGDTIQILAGTWGADAIGKLDEPGTYTNANIVRYKSLTIQPAEGAKVTFTSTLSLGYDDSSTANATMTVKDLTFDGASLKIANYVQTTVEGCTFVNGANSAANGTLTIIDSCCTSHKTADAYPVSQVTVTGCSIDGSAAGSPGIRIRNSGNVTITGNVIKNTAHNGILFESNGSVDNTPVKTVSITDNTITEWDVGNVADGGRAMRLDFGTLAAGSAVTIENNVFRKAETGLDKPDFMKITGAAAATVSLEDNDWNDELRSTVSGNSDYYTVDTATPVALAAVVTTKKEPVAQIGETVFSSINAAFAAVNGQSGDDVTIKILKDVTEELTTDYEFAKNVTLATDVEGGVTLNFGFVYGRGVWALLATKGHILNIEEDVTITNLSQLFGGYYYNDSSDVVNVGGVANLQQLWACWGDVVNVLPTARIVMGYGDGMIKLRCGTLNVTGTKNDADDKQLTGGYITADNDGAKSLNLKDTYVSTSWLVNSGTGTITLDLDNATLELNHESSNGLNLGADATGTINMKNGSLIVTPKLQNVDVINVDATGLTAPVKVVDYTGAGSMTLADYGTINVENGIAYVEDNDLFVRFANFVAQIGETKYESLQDAVDAAQAGDTVEIIREGTYTLPTLPRNITVKGNVAGVEFSHTSTGSIASVPNGATFENVTFTLGNTNYHGFQHAGTINMNNCTLNGLLFSYGDMNFTGCRFKQTEDNYCMWCYGKNVTYTGCTFDTAGKALNVYNEGNDAGSPWNITVSGCTFNSTVKNKAAVNIKETCGSKMLKYNVTVTDCTIGTPDFYPTGTDFNPANALWVISPLVQVDDRNTSVYPSESGITVTMGDECVYPMATMLQLPVTADGGTKLLLTVPDTFFTGVVTYPAGATADEKSEIQSAHLATFEANGLKVWQNYVMGVDGSVAGNKLLTDYVVGGGAGAGEWITLKTPIMAFNPPTDSGITVKYRLLRTMTPDDATSWQAFGELKDTPSFPVNIAGQEGDTFWKIEVVFQGEAANE